MAAIPKNCEECHYLSKTEIAIKCTNPDAQHDSDMSVEEMYVKCPQKEDELIAVRYRTKYRDENLYIVISFLDCKPYEIFAEHASNSDPKISYMLASWDAVTRLASISMRELGVDKVIRQLRRSSRQTHDLPGIMSDLLEKAKQVSNNLILKSRSAI